MTLKLWRWTAILLCTLLVSMCFTHLWQLPPRMAYEGSFWFSTLSMYEQLGPQGPGPIIEVAAILVVGMLILLVRRRRPAFALTLFAEALLVVSFAAWWVLIHPVNNAMLEWSAGAMPLTWEQYRAQWEYTHAARALLTFLGLAALVASVVAETPSEVRAVEVDQPPKRRPVKRPPPRREDDLDSRLDEALEESFPASDPPAVQPSEER